MAFKRLVVQRSPALVWFGAVCFAGVLALENSAVRGYEFVFATHNVFRFFYVVFGLLVVRGLVGTWFRELRVDREARLVATTDGEPVPFEKIGALSVAYPHLLAEGVKAPLYQGSTEELNERHDALAAVLGRGRLQLHSMQRLAHHIQLPFVLLGLVGTAIVVGTTLNYIVFSNVHEIEYKMIEGGALVVSLAILRYGIVGSKTERQLRVDPIAGVLQLEDGAILRFDELGPVTLETRGHYGVKAANRQQYLYLSYRRSHTEKRYNALMTAMLQHQLRRALEAPVVENAFRGVDIQHEIERIAGDSPHKRAALEALTKDPDPTIRERAHSLL